MHIEQTTENNPLVDDEKERRLLSSIMNSPDKLHILRGRVDREVFYRESHRIIFDTMLELADEERPFHEAIELCDRIRDRDGLDVLERIGANYIALTLSVVPSGVHAEVYADDLVRLHQLRELKARYRRAEREAGEPLTDPAQLVNEVQGDTLSVVSSQASDGINAAESLDLIHKMRSEDASPLTPTGFVYFDAITGGVRNGSSYFIGGLYKAGKSKYALAIALAMLESGWSVDWHTCEMNHEEITTRAISSLSKMSEAKVERRLAERAGRLGEEMLRSEASAIDDGIEAWRRIGSRFTLFFEGAPYVGDIYAKTMARSYARERHAVFVDYLQECTARLPGIPRTDRRNIAECCAILNQAGKDASVPVFVIYQLAEYKVMGRQKDAKMMVPVPQAQDGEGSSKIAQAANEVLMVHRPWFELDGTEKSNFVVIKRSASRSGQNDTHYCRAEYGINAFSEWTEPLPEPFGWKQ